MHTINEYVYKITKEYIKEQNIDGSFEPGHNGPHNDRETPVRNTSHWLFTLSRLYELYSEQWMKNAAHKAADYLCSDEARPMNSAFYTRCNINKDFSNGLIGQAWALESLIKCHEVFKRDDCINIAYDVIKQQPYDSENSVWKILNVDGSIRGVDTTFNHQLWYAAVINKINEDETSKKVKKFMTEIAFNVDIYRNGIIFHASKLGNYPNDENKVLKFIKKSNKNIKIVRKKLYHHSVGYHSFNLYAYAMLKTTYQNEPFWKSKKWNKMMQVTKKKEYIESLDQSLYSWNYNPPGLEMAYVSESFENKDENVVSWFKRHIYKSKIISKTNIDTNTLNARLYEVMRLQKEYLINKI